MSRRPMRRSELVWLVACGLAAGTGCEQAHESLGPHGQVDAGTHAGSGGDEGSSAPTGFAPDKGPADTLALPAPGEQAWRYLDGNDTWRYVAPENPGQLYDAAYFDERWFVLHGRVENSEKVVLSEFNWLSWTRDGLSWETITLTMEPFESYTRLASNGESLLLAGTRHVAQLVGDEVVPITALEQETAPPVLLPYPDGYAIGRRDDVAWLSLDGTVEVVFEQQLAQLRAGVRRVRGERSLLVGPFAALASTDGRRWSALEHAPCTGCNVVGVTYGNGRYLAADAETLFQSGDGEAWDGQIWRAAFAPAGAPEDEAGEDRIARLDFTGGHFIASMGGGNARLSLDGLRWSDQLKIPLGQIGPAPCQGRCFVAGGRLLLPPIVLPDPEPPPEADESSPYYCEYLGPPDNSCSRCGGATVDSCREGVACTPSCSINADCPAAESGNPRITCSPTLAGSICMLSCDRGESCPDGMTCVGGACLYVFDNPRCLSAP